ncbi:MAG: ParB/RepB/Spo0J family partition protein [Clostridia bacterium]|nr:ParB/RepB/Spo0J family partition protein [Clostridia bacterium]
MAKKSGLGRGLGSLFNDTFTQPPVSIIEDKAPEIVKPTKETKKKETVKETKAPAETIPAAKEEDTAERVVYLNILDIKPNSAQPRKIFSEEALEELAASIKENGLIQPILVRPAKKGYELVAGERRLRAARKAGLKTIPAIVRNLDERQNAFVALIENMQREDLNIIEEALGIEEIITKYELTQEEAAKAVGKSRSYVTNALRILKLPEAVQELVNSKKLSAGHARAIAGLATEKLQIEAAEKAVKEGWSVRQIESYTGAQTTHKKRGRAANRTKDVEIKNVETQLSQRIGTKVVINGNEKKGKLEIEYYSKDELDRIIELFLYD